MTESSRAGLAGAAGSAHAPPGCPLPAAGNGPASGGCLCPGWVPDTFVVQEELPTLCPSLGAHSSSPPKPTSRGRQSTRVWQGDSGHPSALSTWGDGQSGHRPDAARWDLSDTHPYLISTPTSPPSLPVLGVRCARPPLTARSEPGAPAAGGWPCSACLLTCCFPR